MTRMDSQFRSVLGLGNYRHAVDHPDITPYALSRGIRHFDTAPNYGAGHAERKLAEALTTQPAAIRASVSISTKVGYTGGDPPAVKGTVVRPYSLDTDYVQRRTTHSIDIFRAHNTPPLIFVHNPECLLEWYKVKDCLSCIGDAFYVLQQLFLSGDISGYGVATWDGFTRLFSVDELYGISMSVAASSANGFKAIQLPVNLIFTESAADAIMRQEGVLIDARRRGLVIYSSAPLAGGQLLDVLNDEIVNFLMPGGTPIDAAVGFLTGLGLINVILAGSQTPFRLDLLLRAIEADCVDKERIYEILNMLDNT